MEYAGNFPKVGGGASLGRTVKPVFLKKRYVLGGITTLHGHGRMVIGFSRGKVPGSGAECFRSGGVWSRGIRAKIFFIVRRDELVEDVYAYHSFIVREDRTNR